MNRRTGNLIGLFMLGYAWVVLLIAVLIVVANLVSLACGCAMLKGAFSPPINPGDDPSMTAGGSIYAVQLAGGGTGLLLLWSALLWWWAKRTPMAALRRTVRGIETEDKSKNVRSVIRREGRCMTLSGPAGWDRAERLINRQVKRKKR